MALGELILSGDVLNTGRLKLNQVYSAQTAIWSAGTGSSGLYNVVRGNFLGTNFGNTALGYHNIAAGISNFTSSNSRYSMAFWGSGNTIQAISYSASIVNGRNNYIAGSNYATIINGNKNIVTNSGYGLIAGGLSNKINAASNSSILGGFSNKIYSSFATIGGGKHNTASPTSQSSTIGGGDYNFVNGAYSTIIGGFNNRATVLGSIAGGYYNKAYGIKSISIGGNGNKTTNLGSASVGGNGNKSYGGWGFVGGGVNITVNASYAGTVGGLNNDATGTRSFIGGGNNNTSSGTRSAIIGGQNNIAASNYNGIFVGRNNVATGINSAVIAGFYNTATAINAVTIGGRGSGAVHANCVVMGGGGRTSGVYQLVIGGVGALTSNVANNRFRVDARNGYANGACYANGGFFAFGADYGEFFEWKDKNPNNENRTGYFVSLDEDKIEIGNSNIVGIISSNPSAVGDSADFYWAGMYLTDDFGTVLKEEYKKYEWIECTSESGGTNEINKIIFENGVGEKFIEHPNASHKHGLPFTGQTPTSATTSTIKIPKINTEYDQNSIYVPRSKRKEWSVVGLLGKLHVRTAEQITGKLIDVNSNGMAINGTTYRILEKTRPHTENQYGIVRIFFK